MISQYGSSTRIAPISAPIVPHKANRSGLDIRPTALVGKRRRTTGSEVEVKSKPSRGGSPARTATPLAPSPREEALAEGRGGGAGAGTGGGTLGAGMLGGAPVVIAARLDTGG